MVLVWNDVPNGVTGERSVIGTGVGGIDAKEAGEWSCVPLQRLYAAI